MKNIVEIKKDGVYLNHEKFFLVSGDFHYFRTVPEGWRRRLELMKDFGLTAVTTYVAWNLHEPKRGEYCFEGIADIARFIREADEVGLKVILRCSPYMCAEWEMGGLPSWLLEDRTVCLRSSDEGYFEPARAFLKKLAEQVTPLMYTNGGPIILVGLENEYGSYGNDMEYLRKLSDVYRECGFDVPYVSANGADIFKYYHGTLPENWNGCDCSALPPQRSQWEMLKEHQPDKPAMVGEAWVGRIQFWGKSYELNRDVEASAAFFKEALENDVVINFYMFCGGTNFGFSSGALASNSQGHYYSLMTSYDYDAPISEEGVPRAKYFALRDVLDEYLGKPKRPHVVPKHEIQTISDIELKECAPLFTNMEALAEKTVYKNRTVCMEDLGQNYGFICYKTKLAHTDSRVRHLYLDGLADRATVYLNGEYLGYYMRDEENEMIEFRIPEKGAELTILVENTGRVGYGYGMYDYKGILGAVHYRIYDDEGNKLYNYAMQTGFETSTLPMKDLSGLSYETVDNSNGQPAFYRGTFEAKPGVDTFLDARGLSRGFVVINGFNIGKFWDVGPQRTLYVPGEILKENNVIEVFEVHTKGMKKKLACIDYAILTELEMQDDSMKDFELL